MPQINNDRHKKTIAERLDNLKDWGLSTWQYCYSGIWETTNDSWKTKILKTINLSARSFMSTDLQTQACAMTYRTLLAIVPALALLFAIGRGFGFQNLLTNQLYKLFPSQHEALGAALGFVDSYLEQASEGIFVGVGIVFLLWTLISLMSNVEDSFNAIWQVKSGRSFWRKITDYTAILMILPILMICAGGLSILMSTTLHTLLPFKFMQPAVTILLDCASYVFTWLFFAGAYMMIPNTKVKFMNALIAGIFVGTAFQLLQWMFLTGQMYVSKYNAIYGSFSFLPLLLIWLQLSWLITLIGAGLCHASQNVGQFLFFEKVDNISISYKRQAILAVMAIIAKRFVRDKTPMTSDEIAQTYSIPAKLVGSIVEQLHKVGLVTYVEASGEFNENPLQPAIDVSKLTIGEVIRRLQLDGESGFIPGFDSNYAAIISVSKRITTAMIDAADQVGITSLNIEI